MSHNGIVGMVSTFGPHSGESNMKAAYLEIDSGGTQAFQRAPGLSANLTHSSQGHSIRPICLRSVCPTTKYVKLGMLFPVAITFSGCVKASRVITRLRRSAGSFGGERSAAKARKVWRQSRHCRGESDAGTQNQNVRQSRSRRRLPRDAHGPTSAGISK
jgi:hypothetical protein